MKLYEAFYEYDVIWYVYRIYVRDIMSNKTFLRLIIRSIYVIYLEQFVFAYQYYVKCSAARQFAAD